MIVRFFAQLIMFSCGLQVGNLLVLNAFDCIPGPFIYVCPNRSYLYYNLTE